MIPKAEIKRYDPEVKNEYAELTLRRRELGAQLATHSREVDQILSNLGALVASGKSYKKQTARLAELRLEIEALEAGLLFVDGQCGLLERMNNWLRSR